MPEFHTSTPSSVISRAAVCAVAVVNSAQAQLPRDLVVRAPSSQVVVRPGPFIACAAGGEFYLGVRANGTLIWDGISPPVVVPSGTFVAASGSLNPGGWALLLRDDGSIGFWGRIDYSPVSQSIPPGPFVAISAGGSHALAMRPDGTLVQWGYNALPALAGTYTAISAGGANFSLALRPDGTIAAWGSTSAYGLLSPPSGEFTAITAGGTFALAIRPDGTLAAWGNPGGGALQVPSGTFVEVSAGDQVGLARRADGTVASWGWIPDIIPGRATAMEAGEQWFAAIADCYPNCDASTSAPVLNVGDFTCFLQRFVAGDLYTNCDYSTIVPTLNVADFTCFLQRFAAGCP